MKIHLTAVIVILVSLISCELSKGERLKIETSSIHMGDSVSVYSGLVIILNEPLDLASLDANNIEKMVQYYSVDSGEVTLPLSVYYVVEANRVQWNDEPASFWYHPETKSCAFISPDVIINAENTLSIDKKVSAKDGREMTDSFELTFHKSGNHGIQISPGAYIPSVSTDGVSTYRFVTFLQLPAYCSIAVFNLSGDSVYQIHRENENTGFENWGLTDSLDNSVDAGIYLFEVTSMPPSSPYDFLNGVLVIATD